MSSKRQYWSKMNHDEARHAIELMNDAEAGRWFRGWLAGAGGNYASEDVLQSKPIEWRSGFSAGKSSHEDAKEYSQKQSDRVAKRYTKSTVVDSGSDPVDEKATAELPSGTNNNTTNNEQREITKARRAAFAPPSEAEWVAYCSTTWNDWHPICSGESWAYYQGVDWMVGSKRCKDWKATARTAHGNARQWGKLQPIGQRGGWQQPAPLPLTFDTSDMTPELLEAAKKF